jgi:subtilisin-like proprotein convertase family protein
MSTLALRLLVAALLILAVLPDTRGAAFLAEEFHSDPFASGRFAVRTNDTESVFNFNPATSNITAVLDMDGSSAYGLSAPVGTVTQNDDATFSFNLRVTQIDDRVPPVAFIGLVTTTHVNNSGNGLTMILSSSNGQPVVSAKVDQGSYDFNGASIRLQLDTDYLALGRYTASSRQFVVEIFGGTGFATLLGRSTALVTNTLPLAVDRMGLQNGGELSGDRTEGSMTVVVDNFFTPARPPANISIDGVSVDEPDSGTTTNALISVSLSSPSVQTVRVDYATVDLTAAAGRDYILTNGTLVFSSGVTNLTIPVPIIGDLLGEADETFALVLSNAVNANLVAFQATNTIRDNDFCRVRISDVTAKETLGTNIAILFNVSMSTSNSASVTINFATANGTAVASSDFIGTNGAISFESGVTNATITVWVIGDNVDESNEVFYVNLTNPSQPNVILTKPQGQCVVTNTSPPPSVFFDPLPLLVVEGNASKTIMVPVSLSSASGRPVTVCFETFDDGAIAGRDYRQTNDCLVIPAGQTNAFIPITVQGDRMHELTESFYVFILGTSNAVIGLDFAEIVLLNDDDPPSIDITDSGVVEGVTGTTGIVFAIRLSNPSYQEVAVTASTVDATALAGQDYIATNRTFVFPAESQEPTTNFTVLATGDVQNEGDESFHVRLDNQINATLARSQAVGVITNDDYVRINVENGEAVEGNGGTANLTFFVALSGPSMQQVCVWLTTSNLTARAGSDYNSISNLLCFDPGVTRLPFHVTVNGDISDEFDETFSLYIAWVTNAVPDQVMGIGKIIDDDPPCISIDANSRSVFEGDSNTTSVVFTLTLSTPFTNVVSVNCSTSDGAARAGEDYRSTNRLVMFVPGQVSVPFAVTIFGDTLPETNESFFINLNSPSNATLCVGQVAATILNDDVPEITVVTNLDVFEGSCVEIPITMDRTSAVPVEVWICLDAAPAFVNLDCGLRCCTNVISPGSLSTSFLVCGEEDGLDGGDFEFGFDGGGGGKLFSGRIRLVNTNAPRVLIRDSGVVEGNSGTTNLCFDVRLSSARTNIISVDFITLDGGARAGRDYMPTNGTLIFSPGQTSTQICIPVFGEIVYETNEVFFLSLTNAVRVSLTNSFLRATITNDDQPPLISVNDTIISEGNSGCTQAVFTVSLLTPTDLDVSVGFTSVDMTATNGFDYVPTNGSLTFPPGVTNLPVPVCIIGDLFDEFAENFILRLNSPGGGSLSKADGIGTIIDDDPPEIRVFPASVVEGHTGVTNLIFVVSLSSPSTNVVTVEFITRDGTAQAGLDYTTTNGTLVFLPGDTNRTNIVAVRGDRVTELNETVLFCFTNAINGTLPDPCGTGTILEDDQPCVSISDTTIREPLNGTNSMIFSIALDGPSSLPIAVNYSSSNLIAQAGSDYIGHSGTLIFSNGITSNILIFTINSDLEVEDDEIFAVHLSLGTNSNAKLCDGLGIGVITNSTIPPIVTVNNASVTEGPIGGTSNLVFIATLNRPSPQTVSVDFNTVDDTATNGFDYRSVSGRITFPPGVVATNVSVPVIGDCALEADEHLALRFFNPVFTALATNEVRGNILNDDPLPTLFVDNPAVRERDLERTNLDFTITLSCPSAFPVRVDFTTVNGTATSASDYVTTNGYVVFAPSETTATVSVLVEGDFLDESDETLSLVLSNPQGALLSTNRATGTIINDDDIQIRIFPAEANEGAVANFLVTLSKPPSSEITVAYGTVDNTATAPPDYVATNGVLHFTPLTAGWTNQIINVAHLPDGDDEVDEFYFVNLSAANHGTILAPQAVGTIHDGNPPCLRVTNIVVIDRGTGSLTGTFTVSLSSTSSLPVAFTFATREGTAFEGSDFVRRSGVTNIPPGDLSVSISVTIQPNYRDETNEFFYLDITNSINATICDGTGTCTIATVSNSPPTSVLTLDPNSSCFTLPTNVTLAASASDRDGIVAKIFFYANSNLIGEVPAGSNQVAVAIQWLPRERGDYELTAVAQDNFLAFATSAPVRVTVSWPATNNVNMPVVVEGNSMTNIDYVLTLVASNCQPVSVQAFTIDGTARAGIDYLNVLPTNIVFLPGQTSAIVRVKIIGDNAIEPNETVLLVLTNAVNLTLVTNVATGVIVNDDTNEAPTVSIINPVNGSVFYAPPGIIPILADAQDSDGTIARVEFYSGTSLIGQTTNWPFEVRWNNSIPGQYTLTAVATDNSNSRATSAPVSITIRACSGVLTATPLPNQTACACGPATFSTTVNSPEPVSFMWRFNGRVIPGANDRTLTLQSLTSAEAGVYSVEVRTPCRSITNSATLTVVGENIPTPVTYSNTAPITINSTGPASPYPSISEVLCVPGLIEKMTVSVSNLTHRFVGDIDMILRSPSGKFIKLMSDVHESRLSVTNLNLIFDDDATVGIPNVGTIPSGTYKPTDYAVGGSEVVPPGVIVTNLADFKGESPNGVWGLYIVDDQNLDGGSISGGWSMTIWWQDIPPTLNSPVMLADGRVALNLTSQPGRTHFIEASSDLQHWFTISTNTMVGTNMSVVLAGPRTHQYRFYRAQRCPYINMFEADQPPRLIAPEYLGNGLLRMKLISLPGRNHAIEVSTDLRSWTRVSTNMMDGTEMPVVVPGSNQFKQRFYRAVVLQ